MHWITLFLVTVGIGALALSQGIGLTALGLVSLLIGLMIGYFDMTREAAQ